MPPITPRIHWASALFCLSRKRPRNGVEVLLALLRQPAAPLVHRLYDAKGLQLLQREGEAHGEKS